MTPEQFVYWLQGFAELDEYNSPPSKEQWKSIKEHLALTFNKVTSPITINPIPQRIEFIKDYQPAIC